MALSDTEREQINRRFVAIENILNNIQAAINNLVTKAYAKSILNIRQGEINELTEQVEQLTVVDGATLLAAHRNADNPHNITSTVIGNAVAQWNANQLQDIDISTDTPNDADILVYNDTAGQWEPTVNGGGGGVTDHGGLTGLGDDDHTQYHNSSRAETWLATQTLQKLAVVSDSDTPAKNDHLIFNGAEWVFAPDGTTFTFSIASFTDTGGSTVVEVGTGTWKAIGAISFSATYTNGPATLGEVYLAEWGAGDKLTLSGVDFQGPTVSTTAVTFPSVGSTRQFQLQATDGSDSDTDNNTYYFYNNRFWGVTTKTSGFTEGDIEGLANSELSNSRSKTLTVTAGAGEYIAYSYPSRLGTATFTVGGFEGGFEDPETVNVTNPSGYSENYYIYRSTNSNLGETTVEVS